MPWDSNGNFTRNYDWDTEAQQGLDINGERMNNDAENFRVGIQDCIHRGGYNQPITDLPMGTFRHLNVGDASSRNQYGRVSQIQDNTFNYATDVTGSDGLAYNLVVGLALVSPPQGFPVVFAPNITNTGEVTLSINGGSPYSLVSDGAVLEGGDIVIDRIYLAVFHGGSFHLISGGGGSGTPVQDEFSGSQVAWVGGGSEQTIPHSGVGTVVDWNVELLDTEEYWSPANPSYFTSPSSGIYRVAVNVLMKAYNRLISNANNVAQGFMNENSVNFDTGMQTGPPGGSSRTIMSYVYGETWFESKNPGESWLTVGGTQITNFMINFPNSDYDRYFSLNTVAFLALGEGTQARVKALQQGCMVDMLASNFNGYHQPTGAMPVVGDALWFQSSWFSIERVRDSIPQEVAEMG